MVVVRPVVEVLKRIDDNLGFELSSFSETVITLCS